MNSELVPKSHEEIEETKKVQQGGGGPTTVVAALPTTYRATGRNKALESVTETSVGEYDGDRVERERRQSW